MKRAILISLFALVTLTGWAQNAYTLSCDITPLIEELKKEEVKVDSFYLADFASQAPLTEKFALQGNKVAISGTIDKPQIAPME